MTATSTTTTTAINALPSRLDLAVYSGDGLRVEIRFTYAEGANVGEPYPLTGTWLAQIRERAGDVSALAALEVDATDQATGIVRVRVTPDVARDYAGIDGAWDLQQTPAEVGADPHTWYRGAFTIPRDVTR